MNTLEFFGPFLALLPFELMLVALVVPWLFAAPVRQAWSLLLVLSTLASGGALASLAVQLTMAPADPASVAFLPGLAVTVTGAWLALLVQGLGTVITAFSSRYLEGEPGQRRYMGALSAVLAAVQLLLLADHWFVLLGAWAGAGLALHRLLCFYADRPFAALAAHKKFLADRVADVFLVAAAWLAIDEVGSGSFSQLAVHIQAHGAGTGLQWSAVLLALAVAIRTALLPVHGWLIQVMEAPTPVSALLHAGVVNLGGYVLIRFAPLFDVAGPARAILVAAGLVTAMLAGFVMLTRISIKVRLAWSTLAQMGFMVVECGLGLYELAALHLLGHSLYKAHTFLGSGDVTRQARLQDLVCNRAPSGWNLLTAPLLAVVVVLSVVAAITPFIGAAWPWWWSAILALAWAPLLWVRAPGHAVYHQAGGALMIACLAALAAAAHALPLGVHSDPEHAMGHVVLVGMLLVYLGTAALQRPAWAPRLEAFRRQSYAGFYLDEAYTRLALYVWPVRLPLTQPVRDAHPRRVAARRAARVSS